MAFIAPAAIFGPVLVIIAATGLTAALVTVPIFLLVYLYTFAAGVQGAGLILDNRTIDAPAAFLRAIRGSPQLALSVAPIGTLLAVAVGCMLILNDLGFTLLALPIGVLSAIAGMAWASRHAFEQPLILVHDLRVDQARHVSHSLSRIDVQRVLQLLLLLAAPLALAILLSWGLGYAVAPVVGAGVFVLVLPLWLPLPAISRTFVCARLVEGTGQSAQSAAT